MDYDRSLFPIYCGWSCSSVRTKVYLAEQFCNDACRKDQHIQFKTLTQEYDKVLPEDQMPPPLQNSLMISPADHWFWNKTLEVAIARGPMAHMWQRYILQWSLCTLNHGFWIVQLSHFSCWCLNILHGIFTHPEMPNSMVCLPQDYMVDDYSFDFYYRLPCDRWTGIQAIQHTTGIDLLSIVNFLAQVSAIEHCVHLILSIQPMVRSCLLQWNSLIQIAQIRVLI